VPTGESVVFRQQLLGRAIETWGRLVLVLSVDTSILVRYLESM